MSQLQIAFSIIGVVLILAIIGHGMWTIRRNEKAVKQQQRELARKRRQRDEQGFDPDGIGEVRVVRNERVATPEPHAGAPRHAPVSAKSEPLTSEQLNISIPNESAAKPTQMDLSIDAEDALAREHTQSDNASQQSEPELAAGQERELELEPTRAPEPEPEYEPKLRSEERREPKYQAEPEPEPEPATDLFADEDEQEAEQEPTTVDPEEVIVLHVTGDIEGAVLLQQMTELGFKYGEFDIFHRHETPAGKGATLFSLANMFNPGTFDIYGMESFHTRGVALFLALPVKGSATQAFTMMHNAAVKLSIAVNGQVLDEHRNPLTKQTVQHLHQRIREFERRQLIRASER